MRLVITTYDVSQSSGFSTLQNPVAIAFKQANPGMENIQTHNNRLTAEREGYPLRFRISGFDAKTYSRLLSGEIQAATCTLEPLPVHPHVLQL